MSIVTDTGRKPTCAAHAMTPRQRIDLALEPLDGRRGASRLADAHDVSRKFVYQQRATAKNAPENAFAPAASAPDVLFHLPVTGAWLRQFALVAVLVGHSSLRGVTEMLDCLLDLPVSPGWAHAVVKDAIDKARPVNDARGLSRVRACALDEIFQGQKPVLAAVGARSTYCCLLSQEGHRDGDTWAVRLLELQDQGLEPESAIADFGKGLRAGPRAAWPELGEADADVWRPPRDLGEVVRFLENRAYAAIAAHDKLSRPRRRTGAQAEQARAALHEQDRAIALADGVAKLLGHLRDEVLCVAGPPLVDRRRRCDCVVAEPQRLRPGCEHRLGPACAVLSGDRERLLGFCARLDREVAGRALPARCGRGAALSRQARCR